jgi:hypothetical protein
MFGTLRYNSHTKDVEHVELERADGFEARGYTRSACNACRTRKVNPPNRLLISRADQAYITQLKCSGDKNGCQRCSALSEPCAYQSSAAKSADRLRRQSTQSSTHSTAVSPPGQTQSTENPDTGIVGCGPQFRTPSATSADLSWALTPINGVPDLDWEFSSGEFQSIVDDGQDSSTGDKLPRTPACGSCALLTHKNRPQSPAVNIEVDNDIADVSYNLESSQSSGQYLHRSDQSLNSSASASVSRMHNLSHSSLTMPQQGNKGFPRELPGTQLYQAEGSPRGAPSWNSVLELASTVDPPVQSGKNQWLGASMAPANIRVSASGLGHPRTARMHGSSANALVTQNMASVGSTSGFASFSRSTSARTSEQSRSSDSGSACQCVTMMVKTLENMGVQGLGTDARDTGTGLDIVLMSLARGMHTIEQVLVCGQCNACTDNGMLLATIAQQLGTTAESVTTCLPSQEQPYESHECQHWRQNRRLSAKGPRLSDVRAMDTGGPALGSSNNDDPACGTSDLLGGAIFLGRYEVDTPEIRLQLVYHALLLHTNQLRAILARIKDRVGSNRGARKLLVNTELEVRELWDIFQSKVSHQQ